MSDRLDRWKTKIRERRTKTPFREFVREIASWCPVSFYTVDGKVSRYPQSDRVTNLVDAQVFAARDNSEMAMLDYDPTRDFFDQFGELQGKNMLPILWDFGGIVENCTYSDTVGWGVKNAYLSIGVGMDCENILYSYEVSDHCTDITSSVWVRKGSSNIYMSSGILTSYQIFYSRYITDSSDVWFSADLLGCHECVACYDLTNRSYCIENIEYPKEEYFTRKQAYLKAIHNHDERYQKLAQRPTKNVSSVNSKGKNLVRCEEVENGLYVIGVKRGRNLLFIGDGSVIEDCYDNVWCWTAAERSYGNMGCSPGVDIYCGMNSGKLSDSFYSFYCIDVHHVIGCIGLQHASFCIFNKQYNEDEWYRIADIIFANLEAKGELGAFFPWRINPFYFNDTMAAMVLDYDREEISRQGYLWRDEESRVDIPAGAEVIDVADIDPRQYDETILKKVLRDKNSKIYRIVPMEYAFLKKYDLPLPTTHWHDRMREGLRFN